MIRYEQKNLHPWINDDVLKALQPQVESACELLASRKGPGGDFIGWYDPSKVVPAAELDAIKEASKRIQDQSELLVTVGIGGSYLGARAVLEGLPWDEASENGVDIDFAGHHMSARDTEMLLDHLDDYEVSINVISKSGTTTEPAIAFRLLKAYMEDRYGKDEAKNRIYATTDAKKGALRKLATEEGYATFVIPDDVGGRFSVLSPVGLLPIAAAGFDIDALLAGAMDSFKTYGASTDVLTNDCLRYAASRVALYRQGKAIEILSTFEPAFHYLIEWWKQLNGESEGKNRSGLFPAGCEFSTDLHSMGQWIQEGQRNAFETFLIEEKPSASVVVPDTGDDLDGLAYLAGRELSEINLEAWKGVSLAHYDGGMPNSSLIVESMTTRTMGELIHFFERATGISCYLQGVNPFDQPGVEAYKANMFALLGKPGFEAQAQALRARL
ncbi:MAG: glucose-6-phosphate isomerase [Fibrobacteria bacterium]|nr:glucose-6-phosphate isomerase [Fibrobacteria bacterium]